ncbi:phosphatase domain-containing protein [Bdellovibrio sp. HCB-162]|uniref:phosphatase domain-containing protein n=1 Tax=Bdellovibrio sp. HCB-162 TaxID=3394234 RepID=UPI0039BD49D8
MKHFIALVLFVFSLSAHAQTLFVSDVDDTIKLANVQDISEAARYAFDDKSRFIGMSELYNLFAQEQSNLSIVYLSKAPEWFMKGTHKSFLANGKFPAGTYIGRTNYDADVHKLKNLRKLMNDIKPRKVVFIGDNGEQDPEVYNTIVKEYANQGIEFHQFIRIVYSKSFFVEWGAKLWEDQIGFVTPIEIALEMEKEHLLSTQAVQTMMSTVAVDIVKSKAYGSEGIVAFPYFVNCSDFVWKWDDSLSRFDIMTLLKARIVDRCRIKP